MRGGRTQHHSRHRVARRHLQRQRRRRRCRREASQRSLCANRQSHTHMCIYTSARATCVEAMRLCGERGVAQPLGTTPPPVSVSSAAPAHRHSRCKESVDPFPHPGSATVERDPPNLIINLSRRAAGVTPTGLPTDGSSRHRVHLSSSQSHSRRLVCACRQWAAWDPPLLAARSLAARHGIALGESHTACLRATPPAHVAPPPTFRRLAAMRNECLPRHG